MKYLLRGPPERLAQCSKSGWQKFFDSQRVLGQIIDFCKLDNLAINRLKMLRSVFEMAMI